MSPHNRKPKLLPTILGAFLAFMILAVPHMARADDCTTDPNNLGKFQQAYTNNLHSAIQRISQIKHDHLDPANGFAKLVDTQADYCLMKIEQIMDIIMGAGSPKSIILSIIMSLIQNVLTQACNMVIQVVSEALQGILSIFNSICIPVPKLHLPGFSFLWHGTCKGVNVLPITFLPNPNNPTVPETPFNWQLWGKQQWGQ